MKSKKEIDKQRRFFFKKIEYSYLLLKSNYFLNKQSLFLIKILPKKSYITSIRNLCFYSYRSRSILRTYKLSRIFFQKIIKENKIQNINKASWLFFLALMVKFGKHERFKIFCFHLLIGSNPIKGKKYLLKNKWYIHKQYLQL